MWPGLISKELLLEGATAYFSLEIGPHISCQGLFGEGLFEDSFIMCI